MIPMQRDVIKRLESVQKLPTLPAVIENLRIALQDPEVDVEDIAVIIEDDPAIMARIVKVVNSALYLGVSETTSLRTAIVRLGFGAVSNIAMSAAVFSTFAPSLKAGFNRAEFWRHCICTGIASEIVYQNSGSFPGLRITLDALHLYGLLHDIGKIIFEQYFHEGFMAALELSGRDEVPLAEAELRVMGVDHAQVGAWLARKWNLSGEVIEVIRWHHNPGNAGSEHRDLVRLCYLADMVVNAAQLGDGGNVSPAYAETICGEFDFGHDSLVRIIGLIETRAAQSPLFMAFAA
ncbi:MAG: HDOD domain-containing protein [Desulfobacteraceae bacterium]|nr:HDOD domain-containing protein [Desulfobacteraceae bacterium]MCF8094630.1 HDOD domain-containing protein [Desulfobacteraceae bacterium]